MKYTINEYTDGKVNSPYAQWLRGLSELRIHYGPGYRVYFGKEEQQVYLLLCGGNKSTQSKDIKQAKEYWKDHKRRIKDGA